MWKSLNDEMLLKLNELSNVEPLGIINASINFSEERMEDKGELDHYIGVATTRECPDNLAKLEVSPSTWAVFETAGSFPDTLQNVWGRIYAEWFPSTNYERAEGPSILWTEQKREMTSSTVKSEIWVPIIKKAIQ